MKCPEISLINDPQTVPEKRCPLCDGCVYPPSYFCIRCERRSYGPGRFKSRL